MRRIWKYELEIFEEQIITIPILMNGNKEEDFINQILKVDTQDDKPCMWCLVDLSDNEHERLDKERKIITIPNGNPMPKHLTKDHYIDTYKLYGGLFIGHVFIE